MKLNILFGGAAGQGPNILTHILGEALVKQGYYVFYARDYQSLIRGGHNFNVLTFSDKPVHSNESKIDILIALDEKTEVIHKKDLKKDGIIVNGKYENMYFAGRLFKILGLDFQTLDDELKSLEKRYKENIEESKKGFESIHDDGHDTGLIQSNNQNKQAKFENGTQGVAFGAIESGLDVYYAYPMTPATPLLGELAEKQIEKNFLVLELENEISVVNAGIGSAATGAKAMVGTSGGGFDLMTEGLSLAGIVDLPLVFYLAQRPGPASGVPTYTGQGDLHIARHSGHGEFPRMVLAPGDPHESAELTNQAFYFAQKYKIPAIVISDKHLGESFYTTTLKPEIIKSPKTVKLGRYNSYEKDSTGSATDNPEIIKQNIDARNKKIIDIKKEAKNFKRYKVFRNKNSKNIIVSWGSTKGAILDATHGLDVKFMQILYIEPFPEKIKKELADKNIILIENNATAQLADLIAEKTGVFIQDKNKILRYDGRPFLSDELKIEIEKRLK